MEDRISELPDGVLCHILSFLPTQDAVATSLLSKRWKTLWLSVPVLDLDDRCYFLNKRNKPYSSFVKFVYEAILSRAAHQRIKTFYLSCWICEHDDDLPYSDFKVWVDAAVQRRPEQLKIQVFVPLGRILPSSILSCETLVVLHLRGLRMKASSSVDLPLLKTLYLDHISGSHTRYLVELLNGCPILEDLRATSIYFRDNSNVGEFESLPKLVKADISSSYGYQIPLKATCNVEFLRFLPQSGQECIPVFCNLIHLELYFERYINWCLVFQMMEHCPKLQSFVLLSLSPSNSFPNKIWSCPEFVPECISSCLRKCTLLNYGGRECELQFAKYIMQNSRALQTMTIRMTIRNLCYSNILIQEKLEQELAICPRNSTTCKLLFSITDRLVSDCDLFQNEYFFN